MGRYALTGSSNIESLEVLYAHNVTHFLIDSSDIGKYSAFSSIGSDEQYDRLSYIPEMIKVDSSTQETKNSTLFVYQGSISLDEDLVYTINGKQVFFPANKAGIGAVITERDKNGKLITNPEAVFVYQAQQYRIPLRYAYDGGLIDFGQGTGIESGVFIFPRFTQSNNQGSLDETGAMLYLSSRTVKSQLARLYLYGESNQYFELVHSQDDFLVEQIKSQRQFNSDFVYYQGFRGPIRIWEVTYPSNIEFKPEYIQASFPNPNLSISTR